MSEITSDQTSSRIWLLALASLAITGLLIFRLGHLQTRDHTYYTALAESQRQSAAELSPHRGTIYLHEGDDDIFPVATNQKGWIAYAVPRVMTDPRDVAHKLAPELLAFKQRQRQTALDTIESTGQNLNQDQSSDSENEDEQSLSDSDPDQELKQLEHELILKFDQKTDPYEPILKPYEVLDHQFLTFLETQELDGIILEEQEIRTYPDQTLAAHVLGYVGYEQSGRVGRYGIEGYWQEQLAGNLGFLSGERAADGGFIGVGDNYFEAAQNGDDLVLTIDRVVQAFAEDELKKGVEKFSAESGNIIVMNPKTGAVLAMATYPTFDPNRYSAINDPHVQLNPTVSEIFEPGSILKPVIMAAAIEEDLVTPNTTMQDSGPVKVADITIDTFDGKHPGTITMTEVLEDSNNVGMVWVGQQLGAENMYDYLRRFGLGEKTGIELEGETNSTLPSPSNWNVTTTATASFGQGVALTPLQSLNAINALANDGYLMQPYIVNQRRNHQDIFTTEPTSIRQIVSSHTAEQVAAMMVSVIDNGVAGLAQVPGYYLAGKTGTAQVPDDRGRYSEDQKIITFAGFGPAEDPKFSILIKLDNPAGLSFASGTAAPMFKNLATKLLQYYQIPPSYDD